MGVLAAPFAQQQAERAAGGEIPAHTGFDGVQPRIRLFQERFTVGAFALRHAAEQAQKRAARALKLLSDCNYILARVDSESALLDEVCRLIVDSERFAMAWIGFAEHDAEKRVAVAASWANPGGCRDYLNGKSISWSEASPAGRGPTGTCIRTGEVQVNPDFDAGGDVSPWSQAAHEYGFRSSIALPLMTTELGVFGALNIYACETDAFGSDEVRLLGELARNLYAMNCQAGRGGLDFSSVVGLFTTAGTGVQSGGKG